MGVFQEVQLNSVSPLHQRLRISAYTVTSGIGRGVETHHQALQGGRSGLSACDFSGVELQTWIGRVRGLESFSIATDLEEFDCRNNRLIQLGLEQDGMPEAVENLKQKYGPSRIGIFFGTSTSGIETTEQFYRRRGQSGAPLDSTFNYHKTQNVYSGAAFIREYLGVKGPAQAVSTACSSSAKVFAAAQRFMDAGLCDAAIVGGADSLCLMTLYGFNSLQLVSTQVCRPADRNRDGINIGEACGFAVLERSDLASDLCLLGYGESSDAYHISTPHPQGLGAFIAMESALKRAGLAPSEIDYINLHGTATPANDASEDQAVSRLFGDQTHCSSTKGFTGHTLGAAGIVEAVFSIISIENGLVPASLNTQEIDPDFRANIVLQSLHKPVRRVMSNSFGFGGTNASLIFGRCG
jgi:3-oxoacyl-[acyl-carrier-protein] synthase-1